MIDRLKCFISANHKVKLTHIKNILIENDIDSFDMYDISIGDSIQETVKSKLKEADFALFILTQNGTNSIYELGVCEGLNKEYFVIVDKNVEPPFFIKNRLFLRADVSKEESMEESIIKLINDIKKRSIRPKKRKSIPKENFSPYSKEVQGKLKNHLPLIKNLRTAKNNQLLEQAIMKIFKEINLNYIENDTNKNKGVDFAIWNNRLGKTIGNPIIIEVKQGDLVRRKKEIQEQLLRYIEKSEAKVAILLYLDSNDKRIKIEESVKPLIFAYDIEDFINELISRSFESIILNQRNKIVHS